MHRELISFPYIDSYPAMLFVGFLCGYFLARWRAVKNGIEGRHIDNLTLLIVVFSLAGARLFSWMFYQSPHARFADNFKLWGPGGLVLYGGLIFGLISIVAYAVITRIPILKLADVYAPSLALGVTFGRIGCFLAGCCWGDLCVSPGRVAALSPPTRHQVFTIPALSGPTVPVKVTFPPGSDAFEQQVKLGLIAPDSVRSLPVHPAQLYEAALVLLLCGALNWRFGRRQFEGEIVSLCGMGYGIIRFTVEFFRADNPPIYFGMTLSQVISLAIGFACAGLYWRLTARSRLPGAGNLCPVANPHLTPAAPQITVLDV